MGGAPHPAGGCAVPMRGRRCCGFALTAGELRSGEPMPAHPRHRADQDRQAHERALKQER
jgi:hypothetical protein